MTNLEMVNQFRRNEDIFRHVIDMCIEAENWEKAEEYAYNIRWLFQEADPEMKKYFIPHYPQDDVELPFD